MVYMQSIGYNLVLIHVTFLGGFFLCAFLPSYICRQKYFIQADILQFIHCFPRVSEGLLLLFLVKNCLKDTISVPSSGILALIQSSSAIILPYYYHLSELCSNLCMYPYPYYTPSSQSVTGNFLSVLSYLVNKFAWWLFFLLVACVLYYSRVKWFPVYVEGMESILFFPFFWAVFSGL